MKPASAWTLLAATSALYFLADNEADNDLWIHLLTGRRILAARALPRSDDWSFTSGGAAWVDHEWLAQTEFAVAFAAFGDTGVWLLKLSVGLATAWLIWRAVARRTDVPWLRAAVFTLVVAVMGRGFAMRPQIFTYLGAAATLAWLDRRRDRAARLPFGAELAAVVATFALWANLHGGFVFGLGVLGLYAALPPWGGWSRRAALALAAGAGTCVNPYGSSLLLYIAHELQTPHPITEWQAAALGDPALTTYFLLLAALLASVPFAETLRRQPWRAAVVAVIALMSLRHQRHAPLFALCAAAPLAEQLHRGLAWLQSRSSFALSAGAVRLLEVGITLLAIAQLGLVVLRLGGDGFHVVYDAGDYPVAAVRFLRERGVQGNVVLPLDWGGYVLWHATPALRVSLDGRFATVYPPAAVAANFAFFGDGPAGEAGALLDRYGATMVLAPARWQTPAHARSDWHVWYRDEVAELLIKDQSGAPVAGGAVTGRLRFP